MRKEDGNKENQAASRSKTENGSSQCEFFGGANTPLPKRVVNAKVVDYQNFTPTASSINQRGVLSNISNHQPHSTDEVFGFASTPLSKRRVNAKAVDYQNHTPTASSNAQRGVLTNISNHQPHSIGSPTVLSPTVNVVQKKSRSQRHNIASENLGSGVECLTTEEISRKSRPQITPTKIADSISQLFVDEVLDEQDDEPVISESSSPLSVYKDAYYYGNAEFGSDSDGEDVILPEEGIVTSKGYVSLGPPTEVCNHCHAILWKEERVNKNVKHGRPEFSICCSKGQIRLPKTPPTPYLMQIYNDPQRGNKFKRLIRLYNSMFAFTSMGGKVDHSINNGRAPYIYRLNGQNHHVFGTLIPDDGGTPKFCQLYIYDTENEVQNRMAWVSVEDGETVDTETVQGLLQMLDESNELVKYFRMARDRFKEQPVQDLKIVMKVSRAVTGRENFIGPSNEVGVIMVGDLENTCGERDIIIDCKSKGLTRISDIHPKLMALQYPLLFPTGEDGYHDDIPYVQNEQNKGKKRKRITQKEFYSYKLHVRYDEGNTPRLGGRLFQQYIVDAFSSIEQARLWWFRTHQTELRHDLYDNLKKSLRNGLNDTSNIGRGFILPASFLCSKRYMQQHFQDALAICRKIGHPDIFLTMTTNPMWDEILEMMKCIPGCNIVDSPDIIARVFQLKLEQLIEDIKKKIILALVLE